MPVEAQPGDTETPLILRCTEFGDVLVPADRIMAGGKLLVSNKITGYVSFNLTEDGVQARAKQFVGLVPINPRLMLHVLPRVPLANLTKIVSWLGMDTVSLVALRSYGDNETVDQWMVELLVDAYLQSLEGLRDKGMERLYVARQERGTFPKGRLNLSQTGRMWAAGRAPQISYSWYERTVQTTANEVLRAALEHGLHLLSLNPAYQMPRGSRARFRKLNAMLHTFQEVALSAPAASYGHQAREYALETPPHLSHYRQPLAIARRLLNGGGVSLDRDGDVDLGTSLLINMGELFERLVRKAITVGLPRSGSWFRVLDGNKDEKAQRLLYESADAKALAMAPHRPEAIDSKKRRMTPDLVITNASGTCLLVADVKNKVAGPLPDRADVEQVLAYAVRFRVTEALLIYPRSPSLALGMQAVGRIGGVRVFQYHYDLEATDLMEEADRLGQALKLLLPDEAGTCHAVLEHGDKVDSDSVHA